MKTIYKIMEKLYEKMKTLRLTTVSGTGQADSTNTYALFMIDDRLSVEY